MNIIPYFLSKRNFRDQYSEIPLHENDRGGRWQTVFSCTKKDEKTFIKLCAVTTEAGNVDCSLRLKLIFRDTEIIKKIINPFPHFSYKSFVPSFIQIETNERQLLVKTTRPFPYKLAQESNKILLIDFIIEAPYLHPAWDYQLGQRRSTAAPQYPAGTKYQFSACITEFPLNGVLVPIQQFNHPFACASTFILTDHCDFDTTEKLRLFLHGNNNDGWLNKGLKITKGIFAVGPKVGEPVKNASLEDDEYLQLILELYKDGSEIVPHALKSKGQLSSEAFHKAMAFISEMFHPKTWIDHGCYLKYCYSQGAKENPEYLLVQTLQRHCYNNLWSFHDVNTDALNTLNIFTVKRFGNGKVFKKVFRFFATGKFLVGAHFIRGIIHRNYTSSVVRDFIMYAMANTKGIFINLRQNKKTFRRDVAGYFKKITAFKKFHHIESVPYENDDVLQYSSPLYTEDRRPLHQWREGDLVMFNTFETTHLSDIYNEAALKNLEEEYGTHIGHTYILNDLPYIHSIFARKNGKLVLTKQWKAFVKTLSEHVSDGKIWNPNMGEYVDYILSLQKVSIDYQANNKISVINDNAHEVNGYTLVIPNQLKSNLLVNGVKKKADRSDNNYHFFVLDLPAKTRTRILYESNDCKILFPNFSCTTH